MNKSSPYLIGAERAVVYFDRRRKDNGKWISTVRRGDLIEIREHQCEADALAYVGTEGGSPDPYYRPAAGETGATVVNDAA